MKKTGIWPFYDRNKRSGTLEEKSEYEKEGMDRYPCFGAMGGLRKKELSTKDMLEKFKLEEYLGSVIREKKVMDFDEEGGEW